MLATGYIRISGKVTITGGLKGEVQNNIYAPNSADPYFTIGTLDSASRIYFSTGFTTNKACMTGATAAMLNVNILSDNAAYEFRLEDGNVYPQAK